MGWPEAVWRVGSQACILVGRGGENTRLAYARDGVEREGVTG